MRFYHAGLRSSSPFRSQKFDKTFFFFVSFSPSLSVLSHFEKTQEHKGKKSFRWEFTISTASLWCFCAFHLIDICYCCMSVLISISFFHLRCNLMLSHMVSTQQLMFLYQYLVYLYQFKRKKVSTQFLCCLLWSLVHIMNYLVSRLFFLGAFCRVSLASFCGAHQTSKTYPNLIDYDLTFMWEDTEQTHYLWCTCSEIHVQVPREGAVIKTTLQINLQMVHVLKQGEGKLQGNIISNTDIADSVLEV